MQPPVSIAKEIIGQYLELWGCPKSWLLFRHPHICERRSFQKDTFRPGYTALIELSYIACAWIAGIKYSPL